MRNKAIIFILLSVMGIAVFGFAAMGHAGCIASIASGAPCAKTELPLGEAQFHVGMYKSFSLGILVIMLSVGLFFKVARHFMVNDSNDAILHADFARTTAKSVTALMMAEGIQQRLLDWLSILQRRDPDALVGVQGVT